MNVTELARRLRISTEDLRALLPEAGFDIGRRAIKVDDRTAKKIIENWSRIKRRWVKVKDAQKEEKMNEEIKQLAAERGPIPLPPVVTVREFAIALGLPVTRVIQEFMKNGILASLNERIDYDTAAIVAEDLGYEVKKVEEGDEEVEAVQTGDIIKEAIKQESKEDLVARPPVIVVMGHVDHGKTKLLDTIRKTDVVAGEAGGITQHIGAYQTRKNDRLITFIDTPGHEAFTAMRSRGAKIADVAILVVAADDGVQPQTKEAVKIIKAAELPFIVAINKIDKPESDPERVKRELSELGITPEEWGGDVPMVPISAKAGTNIDKILEMILLVADMNKEVIMANPERSALGTVIESHVDKGEGAVATVLIQNGTLKRNDYLAVGDLLFGRVRAMKNYLGEREDQAVPGTPVRILGFRVAPSVGDIVAVPEDHKALDWVKATKTSGEKIATVEMPTEEEIGEKKLLNIIIKADVLGSLEAILVSLEKFSHPEVGVNVVSKGLGNITEADILLAEASKASIVGFNVQLPTTVEDLAKDKEVPAKTYTIIYDIFGDLTTSLEDLLIPEIIRTDLGRMSVLALFRTEKDQQIIGGRVEDGKIKKGAQVTIMRGEEEVGSGKVLSVQSGKQTVPEVRMGSEAGSKIQTKDPIQEGDILILYTEEKKTRKIEFTKPEK